MDIHADKCADKKKPGGKRRPGGKGKPVDRSGGY